jgi:hypothetical protein
MFFARPTLTVKYDEDKFRNSNINNMTVTFACDSVHNKTLVYRHSIAASGVTQSMRGPSVI